MTCRSFLSCITVEPVVFLYMLAIFLETSVVQDLISTKVCIELTEVEHTDMCRDLGNNNTFLKNVKKNITYKEEKSSWILYNNAVMFSLNLIAGCYIGSWSDKFGRKLVMLIPLIGSIFSTINFIIVSNYLRSRLSLIFISSVFSGLSGGIIGLVANCFGYISNLASGEARSQRIAYGEAMLLIGGTVGMYIGGGMLKPTTYASVFILELCIHIVNAIYVICCVKEINHGNISDEMEQANTCVKIFGGRHILEMISTVCRRREDYKRCYIILSLIASLLVYYGLSVQIALLYLYVTDKPLEWDQSLYSYFYGVNFAVSGIALFAGLPLAYRLCHIRDVTAAILGVTSRMVGLLFLGVSQTTIMMFICPLLFVFTDYSVPALRSMLSKLVDKDEMGKIFAFMAALQNVSFLTGAVFNTLYLHTPNYFCFELVAGFQAVALCILIYLHRKLKNENDSYKQMTDETSLPNEDLPEVA